jgi:beta-lactamase superfamily II metal-dependent hydrolase
MFDIYMLPAAHGDCLWVEYGSKANPHRILIDCGPGATYASLKEKLQALPEGQRDFELLVITHVDDDHIGGSLKLLSEIGNLGVNFSDVWFNAYPHLERKAILSGPDLLGAKQGEKLSELIVDSGIAWNRHFKGRAVVCDEYKSPPQVTLDGGMKITLLSPYWTELKKLKKAWIDECKKAELLPGGSVTESQIDDTLGDESDVDKLADSPFAPDTAAANGSSIAFLAEFQEVAVLFGADAYSPVLVRSLEKLGYSAEKRLWLDAFKAPHHGSGHNFSRDLMDLARTGKFLISTNGDRFKHPDKAAIARMVKYNEPDATLHFNYTSEFNRFWEKPSRQAKYRYQAVYPDAGRKGLLVRIG